MKTYTLPENFPQNYPGDPLDLIRRVVCNARPPWPGYTQRWAAVSEVFGTGSTVSIELCKFAGVNPWDEINKKGRIRAARKPEPETKATE